MGIIASKFFKSDTKSTKENENTDTTPETVNLSDPRSPTGKITRTPIIVDKSQKKEPKSVPLRTKLLKSLKLDPRSPTAGIYRTPIIVEDIDGTPIKTVNCDSPVSIYSCNLSDSIVQDVMTPAEPPANVSGFDMTTEVEINDLNGTLEPDIEPEEPIKPVIQIFDRPNTLEAKRLLEEIICSDDENFIKKGKIPIRKDKNLGLKPNESRGVNDLKGNKLKSRTPLSNITSSANSPNHLNPVGKLGRNKLLADAGTENASSPKVMGQWDQNNTVII